jgi:hypothetical protein
MLLQIRTEAEYNKYSQREFFRNKKIAATVRAKHHRCDYILLLQVLCSSFTKTNMFCFRSKKLNNGVLEKIPIMAIYEKQALLLLLPMNYTVFPHPVICCSSMIACANYISMMILLD